MASYDCCSICMFTVRFDYYYDRVSSSANCKMQIYAKEWLATHKNHDKDLAIASSRADIPFFVFSFSSFRPSCCVVAFERMHDMQAGRNRTAGVKYIHTQCSV